MNQTRMNISAYKYRTNGTPSILRDLKPCKHKVALLVKSDALKQTTINVRATFYLKVLQLP